MKSDNLPPALAPYAQEIPRADFIHDVDAYLETQGLAYEEVFTRLQQNFMSYKNLESKVSSQRQVLEEKIPDIERTRDAILFVQSQKEKDMSCQYEVTSGAFMTASIEINGTVCLWIGANLMVEYPIDEALTLLGTNLSNVQLRVDKLGDKLKYLQEQVVMTQVSMARLHNWIVVKRKKNQTPSKS